MDEVGGLGLEPAEPERAGSRRRWLAHCTALGVALSIGGTWASGASAAAANRDNSILVVGDSLSAEYGLRRGSGWVALLSDRLAERHIAATVVNASISGDTTAGGLSRLPALLKQDKPSMVILELGANDALRGLSLAVTRENLDAMTRAAQASGAKVVIVGMQLPPNYGRKYGDEFAGLFPAVAQADGVALVPFLLRGVADAPEADSLFQADRIHPKEAAHPTILENVWSVLEPLLRR